ncbi:hypothetical protein [Pseudoalteromonas piscicida]|uniref:hypothetical protein n=1 Tax=Pseudoalteromonas piscicida TaxID=43662 RepID=UPI0030A0902F
MDVNKLKSALPNNTELVLGNVQDTIGPCIRSQLEAPVGFISFDLDLYSSTKSGLKIFHCESEQVLSQVALYFDDINHRFSHFKGGEQLVIREFNQGSEHIVIDKWHNIKNLIPFPESAWLDRFYLAHNLESLANAASPKRVNVHALKDK